MDIRKILYKLNWKEVLPFADVLRSNFIVIVN